jgi:hypothetical protein
LVFDIHHQTYNKVNPEVIENYIQPQVLEFEDMHYIERRRLEQERGKNLELVNKMLEEVYQRQGDQKKE